MAREQRKLAAILAADVVGYSRLMGRDESSRWRVRPPRRGCSGLTLRSDSGCIAQFDSRPRAHPIRPSPTPSERGLLAGTHWQCKGYVAPRSRRSLVGRTEPTEAELERRRNLT